MDGTGEQGNNAYSWYHLNISITHREKVIAYIQHNSHD